MWTTDVDVDAEARSDPTGVLLPVHRPAPTVLRDRRRSRPKSWVSVFLASGAGAAAPAQRALDLAARGTRHTRGLPGQRAGERR